MTLDPWQLRNLYYEPGTSEAARLAWDARLHEVRRCRGTGSGGAFAFQGKGKPAVCGSDDDNQDKEIVKSHAADSTRSSAITCEASWAGTAQAKISVIQCGSRSPGRQV